LPSICWQHTLPRLSTDGYYAIDIFKQAMSVLQLQHCSVHLPCPCCSSMSGPSFAVHPEHVQLSILISALVAPPPDEIGWGIGFDGPTAQRQLALLLLEEVQDSSSPTLTPLPQLLLRLELQLGQAGAVLSGALAGSLRGLRSPDDMVTVFQGFSTLLAAPGSTPAAATDACSIPYIATTSPLGLFLRRVRLGLSGMSIQGLATLSGQIQQQLQQLDMQQAKAAAAGDINAAAAAAGRAGSSGALKDQAVLEAYVNQLLSAVESQGPAVPVAAVEEAISQLSVLQPQQPKLEYLRMAVSMAHKDMHAALASLHGYFDTSGSSLHGGSASAAAAASGLAGGLGAAAAAAAGQAGSAAAAGAKSKGRHQAALHSLAALHAHVGHPQEARAALQELLRLGQQHGDEWSLLHALAGLCRVLGMSEGLQMQGSSSSSSGRTAVGSSSAAPPSASAAAGWGLLDFRRTEQQLQLQALLRRCLSTARDMRAPHIAAFAAVALARFGLQHASSSSNASGSSGDEDLSAEAAAAAAADSAAAGAGGSSSAGAAAAATSVMLQRMLLDVATLEHQAAIAAAAPGTPAVVAAAPVATAPGQQPVAPNLAARSTDLYNPSEAFGTGTSSTAPGSVSAAGPASKLQLPGLGWRAAAAAAVSQALATAHLVAAGGLALQGASSLAGVRLLMLLTGPGGDGAAAAAAAALVAGQASSNGGSAAGMQQEQKPQAVKLAGRASVTGCGVRYEDATAAWGQLVELVTQLQGTTAGQFALQLAQGHFPASAPPQHLAAAQQLLTLRQALAVKDMPAAKLACEELQCLAPSLQQLGLDVQLAAAKAHAQLHAAAGCWEEAHSAAAALFVSAASSGMQPQALEALMLMARASLAAGDAAGALPCALSALLHCQQLQLDSLLPEAVLLLAAAWQALEPGGSGFCEQLLQQVLPLAYALGAVKLQGELEEALAKAMLLALQDRAAQSAPAEQQQQQQQQGQQAGQQGRLELHAERLAGAAQRLAAAAASYEQAGCWGEAAAAWLALAHVLDASGEADRRNEAAAKWHACKQKLWQAGRVEAVKVAA
jgi:anaphase-promoting complex subunit 5